MLTPPSCGTALRASRSRNAHGHESMLTLCALRNPAHGRLRQPRPAHDAFSLTGSAPHRPGTTASQYRPMPDGPGVPAAMAGGQSQIGHDTVISPGPHSCPLAHRSG